MYLKRSMQCFKKQNYICDTEKRFIHFLNKLYPNIRSIPKSGLRVHINIFLCVMAQPTYRNMNWAKHESFNYDFVDNMWGRVDLSVFLTICSFYTASQTVIIHAKLPFPLYCRVPFRSLSWRAFFYTTLLERIFLCNPCLNSGLKLFMFLLFSFSSSINNGIFGQSFPLEVEYRSVQCKTITWRSIRQK